MASSKRKASLPAAGHGSVGSPAWRQRGTRWIPQVRNPNGSLSHFQAHTSSMWPSDRSSWLGLESKAVVRTSALLSNSEHEGKQGPHGALEEKAQGFALLHRKRGFPYTHTHTHRCTHIQTQHTHIQTTYTDNTHTQMHTHRHTTHTYTHNIHTQTTYTHSHWQGPVRCPPVGSYAETEARVAQWGMWWCGISDASLGVASRFLGALYFHSFSLRHQLAEPIPLSQWLPICQQQEGREPLPEPGHLPWFARRMAGVWSGPQEDKPPQACPTVVSSCRPDKGQCILCDRSLLRLARAP